MLSDLLQNAKKKVSKPPSENTLGAYHDLLAESSASINVGNTAMYVHFDGDSLIDKDLLKQHSGDLASFNIRIRDEMAFGTIWVCPTEPETIGFHCAWLN